MSRERGPAEALHGPAAVALSGRAVRLCRVTRPAVVLGSTQPASDVDRTAAARAGYDVVRRRTGGGAVLVEPGALAWVDVVVPRRDPLWEDDVGRSFWWLGGVWAAALAALGLDRAEAHGGGLVSTPWSAKVCFAGLGPGEVTLGGRKVVGMAQRRTREGALFQCAVPLGWRPERLLGVLNLSADQREAALGALAGSVAPVAGRSVDDLETALVRHLP